MALSVHGHHPLSVFQLIDTNLPWNFHPAERRALTEVTPTGAEWAMGAGPEISIAEIAFLTGFANSNHFTTRFSKAFGTTPTAWRIHSQEK